MSSYLSVISSSFWCISLPFGHHFSLSRIVFILWTSDDILNMEDTVANAVHMRFDIDIALERQSGAQPLPFPGMDSKFKVTNRC